MSTKRITSIDGLIVTTPVISSMFGVTDRRVRQLVEEGLIDRVKNGSYDLAQTVKRYVMYLRASADSKELERDPEAAYLLEKTKHEAAKREIAEIELAQIKGRMHDSKDIERVMTDMLMAFRAKMLSMPSKTAPMLIAQNEIAIIQDIIQKEVHEALAELAEYDPLLFYGDKYVDIEALGDEETEGDADEDEGEQ